MTTLHGALASGTCIFNEGACKDSCELGQSSENIVAHHAHIGQSTYSCFYQFLDLIVRVEGNGQQKHKDWI